MATKAKTTTPTTVIAEALQLDPAAAGAGFIDPAQIAAAADTQRCAILVQLAQATQIPEADLLISFGFPA